MPAVFVVQAKRRRETFKVVSRYWCDVVLKFKLYVDDMKYGIGFSWLAVESQQFLNSWFYKKKKKNKLLTDSITAFIAKNKFVIVNYYQ